MKKFIISCLLLAAAALTISAATCLEEFNHSWNQAQDNYINDMYGCQESQYYTDPGCVIEAYGNWVDSEESAVEQYECCSDGSC